MGIQKAAVLPVPFFARARTLRPGVGEIGLSEWGVERKTCQIEGKVGYDGMKGGGGEGPHLGEYTYLG